MGSLSKQSAQGIPIWRAARFGLQKDVRQQLEAGISVDELDPDTQRTPLLWASFFGDVAIVRELVQAGANIEVRDHEGYTSFCHAVKNEEVGTVCELVKAGAIIDQPISGSKKSLRTKSSALHVAAYYGWLDMVKCLVETRSPGKMAKYAPQQIAIQATVRNLPKNLSRTILEFAEPHGINLDLLDGEGQLAVDVARQRGYRDIVDFLSPKV